MEQQINELMTSIKECLVMVISESSEIANDFQLGNTGRANQKLISYSEKMSCLLEAVVMLRSKNANVVANVQIEELQKILEEMLKAMMNKDYVLIADILEYEIKETLIDIQGKI